MADRIRQNINATKPFAPAVGIAPPIAQTVYYLRTNGVTHNCYTPTASGNCSSRQQVAEKDIFDWQAQIAASLPAGEGIVCQDLTPDDGSSFAAPQCDNLATSPWVIKIFWVVRSEDQVNNTDGTPNIQRFSMMLGPV